ncbi:MAG: MbnP family protein [Flavobacteriaceae bacterium]
MKFNLIILAFTLVFVACEKDNDDNISPVTAVNFKFIHKWEETEVSNSDFNSIQFTNAYGNELSIERLRYLISKIKLTKNTGEVITIDEYNLVDLEDANSLNFSTNQTVAVGSYSDISFVFGFTNEDNTDGTYADLNSATWNVPAMLGGGYHYMQMDGKYINNSNVESGYNYHAIRAVDNPGSNPTFPQDTFFEVSLGEITLTGATEITIAMNIAQWFKQPNTWNLNEYNQMLMPNSTAQILMYQNGQNVFNLVSIE